MFRQLASAAADHTAFGAALTQYFPDVSDGENSKKAPDTRTNLKLGSCGLIELRHFIDGHLRLPGQELDRALGMGFFPVISVHVGA